MARIFTKETLKHVAKCGVILVVINISAQACHAGASGATPPAKTTITKLALIDSGKPQIKITTVGKSLIVIAPPKSDSEAVTQAKGTTKTYTLPSVKPGKKVTWAIVVKDEKGKKVLAQKTYTWQRPELMAQVVYASSKDPGAKAANVTCPKGTDRIRVWTLSPGKAGSIVDPGVLTVRMANGKDVFIDDPDKVGKTWEFYQFDNGKIATKNWFTHYVFPVTATPKAQPQLKLRSDCIERI